MNYQEKMEEIISQIPKGKTPKLLLHACCAPCSSYCIEYLSNYFEITIYYYNPNIDTKEEFDKRVNELNRFVSKFKVKNPVKVVVEGYDNKEYYDAVNGHENDEEGSNRCFICYELRLDKAASYAKKNKFNYFTTTLSISPYKNSNKLNEIGEKLADKYKIKYLYADFKKKNGYKRSIELSREYNLYRQDYCGCKFSKVARDKREKLKEERNKKEVIQNELGHLYNSSYNKEKKNNKKDLKTGIYHFDNIGKMDLIKPVYVRCFKAIVSLGIVLLLGFLFYTKVLPIIKLNIQEYKENKASFNYMEIEESMDIKDVSSNMNEIYIYGNHLNIKGSITTDTTSISDVNLFLLGYNYSKNIDLIYGYDDDSITYSITNDLLNTGFKLDELNIDKYNAYIEVISNDIKSYYKIKNITSYEDTSYYTVVDDNGSRRKIDISTNSEKSTLMFNVTSSDDDVYDVVIDAGHGGSDSGACKDDRCETDYTLDYAKALKAKLEVYGYKVALTRTEDVFNNGYGEGGRVNVAHASNAKLLISIHLNSNIETDYRSFELYTPYKVDYSFARKLVSDIKSVSGLPVSKNPFARVEDSIYTRTMAESDLTNLKNDADKKGYTPFNATLSTNYYFMIRETGGYMTGAYCDGRDNEKKINYYVNSNKGVEAYILEVGYINSDEDIAILNDKSNDIFKAVAADIYDYLSK